MIPKRLQKGDLIGVIAPSDPISDKNKEEIQRAKKIVEEKGFRICFSKNFYCNTNGYSATPKEKAEDLNAMFLNPEVKMIWCAKGGENSNGMFEFIDYEAIKNNPKIFCGYSDNNSLSNLITEKTGLVTFDGTNFKTIATDETDFSFQEILKRLVDGKIELGKKEDYYVLNEGKAEGTLVGGNLSLIKNLTCGKYAMSFQNKVLFLEELGLETSPALASNFLSFMKQNGVFNQIKGLWIGHYEHETEVSLEKIVLDVIGENLSFPIIKSDNFGHLEEKIVIPIGIKAKIDTESELKISLLENCVK